MAELAQQITICKMRHAGNSPFDIIKSTGYTKMIVYQVVTKFDVKGKVERSCHKPQKD